MRKYLFIVLMFLGGNAFAGFINYPTVYSVNSQVTNVTLNGDNNAISNVVNGGLDNTNANTTAGYRFYQTVSSLPAYGNTGQVYYLTTDNSLNFDTGSSFIKTLAPIGSPSQGEVVIYGGSGLTYTGVGSSGQPLISQGAGANATFGNITLAGSVSAAAITSAASLPSGAGIFPRANIGGTFGSWSITGSGTCGGLTGSNGCVAGVIFQAGTDGIVTAWLAGNTYTVQGLSDSSATPSTVRISTTASASGSDYPCITYPVKKGDYFETTTTGGSVTMFFMPVGS